MVTQVDPMPHKVSDSSETRQIAPAGDRTVRALEELADRLDAIATGGPLGRWLGGADARLKDLVRTGRIRPPLRRGRVEFDRLDLPAGPESRALHALLEERRGGR